jgi:hypothetical protein
MSAGDLILYGLRIRSDVALPGRSAPPGGEPDLEIVTGSTMDITLERPDGELIAEDDLSETEWYRFVRRPGGDYHLRYASVCDFVVSADLRRVVVHPVAGIAADRVAVFASGGLPAFVLVMGGHLVLHASAVDVGGQAIAFVGPSGMGKSTMATLCCAAGARLVTDDVLRLDTGHVPPGCYFGPDELRLRKSSGELAALFEAEPSRRRTGDGRDALAPLVTPSDGLPLAAIVVPLPDRDASQLSVNTIPPVDALMTLLSFPRHPGWAEPESQAGQLQHLGALVESTPVYAGRVPWGPPFPSGIVGDLVDALGLHQSGRSI